ncbi:MAG: hypothetical protein RR343_04065, partial [Oscillospiraceae bacterium]
MIKKNNSFYKKKSLLASKGFYIALSLCVIAAGVTVLEALSGSLLNVAGIRDVYIYNNNSGD